jgi:demethoxyubiquinone hydroxylase (CLK1/Coq7/Cat5 family)
MRNSSTFSYKSLPKESQKALDRIIRVDHAGTFLVYHEKLIYYIFFLKYFFDIKM